MLGETLLTGIGQGYIQTTPITTMFNDCSNCKRWVFRFILKLILNKDPLTFEQAIKSMEEQVINNTFITIIR